MGDYPAAMRDNKWGDGATLSALKDLKDLRRNPLIHPDHSLESVDDAIALLGSIHACVVRMLKVLPVLTQVPMLPKSA